MMVIDDLKFELVIILSTAVCSARSSHEVPEWVKMRKLLPPIQYRASQGRPSKSRPPMNHCKTDLGIQNRPLHAEICQSSASTTLADLLMPPLAAYPFSAVWTPLWRWSS